MGDEKRAGGLPVDLTDALARTNSRAVRFDARMAALRKRLLQEGGREVLFQYPEPDVAELLASGQRFPHRVQGFPGPDPHGCHRNVVGFFQAEPERFRIGTGYGLNPYGIWIQHSWLLDADGRIYETTTTTFEVYFGIVQSEEQARRFCREMLPMREKGR